MKEIKKAEQAAIKKAASGYKKKRGETIEKTGLTMEQYRQRATDLRKKPFDDFEKNLETAKKNLIKRGFQVKEAKDDKQARGVLKDILKDSKKVAYSKTNTGREIGIGADSELKNFWPTDLGDFVVKLMNSRESHYVIPAVHLNTESIVRKIEKKYHKKIKKTPEQVTQFLCRKIREKILESETGITGANFISQSGEIVLLENEGNISLVSRIPRKHIVIAGIDKIADSTEDAVSLSKTAAVFGTGQEITQYISIISGPSKTADIENVLVEGAQGAKEVYVILLDNGRRELIKRGLGDILRCINCGACINFCPVYNQLGNNYGSQNYIGAKGLVYSSVLEGLKNAKENGSFKCTFCGGCYQNCPMMIDLPKMVKKVRERQHEKSVQTDQNKQMLEEVKDHGNPFGKKVEGETPDKLYCC